MRRAREASRDPHWFSPKWWLRSRTVTFFTCVSQVRQALPFLSCMTWVRMLQTVLAEPAWARFAAASASSKKAASCLSFRQQSTQLLKARRRFVRWRRMTMLRSVSWVRPMRRVTERRRLKASCTTDSWLLAWPSKMRCMNRLRARSTPRAACRCRFQSCHAWR